jgi:hypothetical protein
MSGHDGKDNPDRAAEVSQVRETATITTSVCSVSSTTVASSSRLFLFFICNNSANAVDVAGWIGLMFRLRLNSFAETLHPHHTQTHSHTRIAAPWGKRTLLHH